jgi:hypothetical protein
MHARFSAALLFVCALFTAQPAHAYSLLTHEELIDLTWQTSIVPLLLSRYPNLTPAQLDQARAYAYGGCVIQDIGYYPFGEPFFSDLTHYVRSGDFVVNLFRDAHNANELAFAVGALSHYVGDSVGHATATNLSVPVEFPKLRDRYGDVVSYAEGEHQHVQTEFAFDIDQTSKGRMAPVHYLRHIGLKVPTHQLALAFYQTYGLNDDLSRGRGHRINVRGYRFAVHGFIPRIAYALTLLHRHDEPVEDPNAPDIQRLNAEVRAVVQQNHWDEYRRHAGVGTYMLAGFLYIVPKFGPLKLVAVKGPTPSTDQDYVHSVLRSTDDINNILRHFTPGTAAVIAEGAQQKPSAVVHAQQAQLGPIAVAAPDASELTTDTRHPLINRDLDTGYPVRPAGYSLTDYTYAVLLHRLTRVPSQPVPPGVKADVLAYYANLNLPFATKKKPEAWAQVQTDLATFRAMPTSNEPPVFQTYGDGTGSDAPAAASPER